MIREALEREICRWKQSFLRYVIDNTPSHPNNYEIVIMQSQSGNKVLSDETEYRNAKAAAATRQKTFFRIITKERR